VVDSEGRYDAFNGGNVENLHWVLGNEPIALEQLKDGYYEPGLLAKLLGYSDEPLRPVPSLADLKLYPEVLATPPASGSSRLTVRLKNRGGGIGPVDVYINDKQVIPDARPVGFDPGRKQATLTVELPQAPAASGRANRIQVFARNARGDLQSRGVALHWVAPGPTETHPLQLFAVVAGVSTYAEPKLNLRFAAKDAVDVARALLMGARHLFGIERAHLTLLSSSPTPVPDLPPAHSATRAEFQAAFQQIASAAHPEDVVVVYLSGHGVAFQEGQAQSRYAYLTQEARTTDLDGSPFLREWCLTGEDLWHWLRDCKARKQVLILDTCAAGAAAKQLTEAMRASADQIRAIERLKDRTGFHILMGCAADRVSWEASQFRQGLLTYAVLEGMKGAALRQGEVVDVSTLFQYARDRVPVLAKQMELGLQDPQVSAPKGDSFPLGILSPEERAKIELRQAVPLLMLPTLLNADAVGDTLQLTAAVQERLRDRQFAAERGTGRQGPVAWLVEGEGLPGAFQPSGLYTIKDGLAIVRLALTRNAVVVGQTEVSGLVENPAKDVTALAEKVAEAFENLLVRR
jgi:uncharacterized caspase-like protein